MPMASIRRGAVLRQIHALYRAGTCSGLTDGQLLERYLAGRGERAELAFAALIERHGPMVLRVCRSVLRDEHDAEDAFQATFLVLARRAGSIRRRGSLGSWLFGVATRVARCARSEAARRRRHERRRAGETLEAIADPIGDDLEAVIHREVERLPERLRAAVVLCYFEGQTCEQAAGQLDLPVGTIKSRLSGARARLRSQLARSGHAPDAATMAAWPIAGPLLVPDRLSDATLAAAMAAAAGRAMPGLAAPTSVAFMGIGFASVALALTWIAAATGNGSGPSAVPPSTSATQPRGPAPEDQQNPGTAVLVRGRAIDPDDRPVAGASVRIGPLPGDRPDEPGRRAVSGPDGRFALAGPVGATGEATESSRRVVATAPGFGPGWADLDGPKELTIRLVADTPIEGRIVDAHGRPIAGVKARIHNIWASPEEDLTPFIADVKGDGRSPWVGPRALKLLTLDATATTDADGRFRLEGIGRERVAAIALSGPTIVTEEVYVMTRTSPVVGPVGWERLDPAARSYRGARFEHAAASCRPVAGTVRDAATGRPIAGAKVRGKVRPADGRGRHPDTSTTAVATTDDRGRYLLTGLPPGDRYFVSITSTPGIPHLGIMKEIDADTSGDGAVGCDFGLREGILVRGRTTDRATGHPVAASVSYLSLPDNPPPQGDPDGVERMAWAGGDGRFEIAVPSGRGVLVARTSGGRYLPAVGADRIEGLDRIRSLVGEPRKVVPDYQAVVEVNPAVGSGPMTRDIALEPVRTATGTVIDPDGKPVAETVARGLDANVAWGERVLMTPGFTVENIDPRRPRRVDFFHVERRLAGSVRIEGDEASPVRVRLQPWGVVAGRIVEDRGKPASGLVLTSFPPRPSEIDAGVLPRRVEVGDDGRFRVEGLVPGLRYSAYIMGDPGLMGFVVGNRSVFRDLRIGPGETRDLGDVRPLREDTAGPATSSPRAAP
jgi:RNA polymerase sigma factor (sigma-70 family)